MANNWMWARTKLDPAYNGMDRGYNSGTGALAPAPLTAPRTNATSRIIPPPSNTNWNSTFLNNQPSSPSGTDWQKTFGEKLQQIGGIRQSGGDPIFDRSGSVSGGKFNLSLSGSENQSQLRIPTSDFQDRTANLDLTTRDHELYGAGPDYGFTY